MLDCTLFIHRRVKDLHMMSLIKLYANDFNIIYSLFQMLENYQEDKEMVVIIMKVLLIPIVLAQHPETHVIEPEKMLGILKKLNLGGYSYKIAVLTKLNADNQDIQKLGRQILVGIDALLNSKF